jgi:hypothetical protein
MTHQTDCSKLVVGTAGAGKSTYCDGSESKLVRCQKWEGLTVWANSAAVYGRDRPEMFCCKPRPRERSY